MRYEQGSIVVVPFPFSDLSEIKQRPVLILSKTSDNKNSEDVITCGITSNIKDSKHSVFIKNKDLERGAIPKPSRIKVDKLFTINQRIIRKSVAKLDSKVFEKVRREFIELV